MGKVPTKEEQRYMDRVAQLGCIIDGCEGLAGIHHCKTHLGGGRDHSKILPLCGAHHQTGGRGIAIHPHKKLWESIYGTEEELMEKVAEKLA